MLLPGCAFSARTDSITFSRMIFVLRHVGRICRRRGSACGSVSTSPFTCSGSWRWRSRSCGVRGPGRNGGSRDRGNSCGRPGRCWLRGGTRRVRAQLRRTGRRRRRLIAPPVIARPIDEVLGVPSYFALGFLRPGPEVFSELSPRAFGAPRYGRLVRVCRSRRSGTPT